MILFLFLFLEGSSTNWISKTEWPVKVCLMVSTPLWLAIISGWWIQLKRPRTFSKHRPTHRCFKQWSWSALPLQPAGFWETEWMAPKGMRLRIGAFSVLLMFVRGVLSMSVHLLIFIGKKMLKDFTCFRNQDLSRLMIKHGPLCHVQCSGVRHCFLSLKPLELSISQNVVPQGKKNMQNLNHQDLTTRSILVVHRFFFWRISLHLAAIWYHQKSPSWVEHANSSTSSVRATVRRYEMSWVASAMSLVKVAWGSFLYWWLRQ